MVLNMVPFDNLLKGAIALGIVLVALGAALYGAGKVSDENTYKSVFAMATVVAAITLSLSILSFINWVKLTKACVALGAMLLVIALDFREISKVNNAGIWKSIVAMVGMILMITISLAVLALQPWQGLLAGAASMAIVLETFADVMKKISGMTGIKPEKIGLFLLATASLIPITISLAILANQPWSGLLAAGVAIDIVLSSFADTLQKISSRTGIKKDKINNFLECSLVLLPITLALGALSYQPWDGLLAAGVSLALTLEALAGAFYIISKAKTSPDPISLFLSAVAMIAPIAVALYFLADQPWDGLLAGSIALSTTLVSFGTVFALLALIGPAATAVYPAILAFDVFVASFAVVLIALGALLQSDTVKNFLNGGIEIMGKLGGAIGDFIGNIIAGIGQGIGTALEGIGEGLEGFWNHAQPFFDGVSNIDPRCLEGIKMIAQAVLILTAADVIKGFADFVGIKTTSLTEFGEQLANMAPSIRKYGEEVADIDAGKVAASAAAVEIMATAAAKLPRQAEWVDKIFGTKQTLSEFGEELEKFGPSIKAYGDSVADIDPAAVEASATAAGALSELANNLPKHGGLLQDFLGDTNLEEFGNQLEEFGYCLVRYSKAVSEDGAINKAAIECSANAGQIMVDLANTLPNSGGVLGFFCWK